MQSTVLSFANMHHHGELFANVLRARRDSFILKRSWDLPETMGMEYDQYDTPASRYVAVHDDTGRVLAGARLTPTTARCGIYSYMVRDAQNGLLDSIPQDLLYDDAPVDESVWEVTRGFIGDDVPTNVRLRVRLLLTGQIVKAGRELCASRMVALLPSNWTRWSKRAALDLSPAGRVMNMGGIEYQAVWFNLADKLH
ncbi:N-acyl-L-homoserine lactone synthetase [Marivivens donghaensis]|uniref:acyl-homoserine-lactone synthase n=1 Tax=Marivivens donghaensis TaxID=1699413 RepID=A0ABX0VWX6_9RHOB|nr:acyl-homoserine-lactone synthase [Marivivens donghaensis]NIY71791.1 N-acyl-L-homoserine lactone synthetase [Marivivens donghaensis]